MADTQSVPGGAPTPRGSGATGRLPKLGERLNRAARSSAGEGAGTLTCQWCSVNLPAGETICPTCGSPGVADTSMVVPDLIEAPLQDAVTVQHKDDSELVEWWKEDAEPETYKNSASQNDDPMPVILGLAGTAVVCIVLGILVAPILLASLFESSLGITVENSNDLRPLGGVLGLLMGAFIGAVGMWVAAPRR
jgi:hypothetical protein